MVFFLIRNDKNNSIRKDDVFEQKFMQHFETINKTPTTNKQDNSSDNQELKFKKTLIDYSSKSSPIDAITLFDGLLRFKSDNFGMRIWFSEVLGS